MDADLTSLDAATAEALQRRAAAWIGAAGLVEGDRLAIVAPSAVEVLVVGLAALRIGVVPVLVNAALTEPERRLILDDAEPRRVLDAAGLAAATAHEGEAELAPWPRSRPMLYTSGTTGRPKGVWTGLLADDDAAALVRDEADLWGFAADDRHLVSSRLHHSAPFRFAAGTLLAGGTVAVAPGAHDLADAVRRFRPTTTFVAPVHLQRLLDGCGDRPDDLASFRLVAHAGSPCPTPLKERALAALPEGSVWEFYGSTEGQFTVCSPEEWRARPGTVGRARPGRELSVDDDGVIWCRPPAFARFSYWRDEAKTAVAWRDGAFTVGDLGRLDDGFVYLDGRRDDLIITGGVNVYPLEVERVVLDHPGVREAVVFPVDDDRWGQMVCAAVVGGATEDELRAHVASRLAPYKRPKVWHLVDALPHTPTGKLRRSEVAGQLGR